MREMQERKKMKRQGKVQKKQATTEQLISDFEREREEERAYAEKSKHAASESILRNRGLTRFRGTKGRKKAPIARVKHREKHAKAVKKRTALVRQFSGVADSYAGERTGIKANISRSTKLVS